MMNIEGIKAITFDCYGTLIDWETGILNVLRPWACDEGVVASDDDLLAAFSKAEPECEQATPTALYPDILRAVHGVMATGFGVECNPDDANRLAGSVGDWPAFADTVDALRRLKERFRLVIISNVDRASFARTNRKLGVQFDAIITAEDVGAYKPDHRMFHYAFGRLEAMGVGRNGILHAAQSLFHDHVPAKALGLRTVWVDRRGHQAGSGATRRPDVAIMPDAVVGDLATLASITCIPKGVR